jgi:predicted metal-dependent hydrolase
MAKFDAHLCRKRIKNINVRIDRQGNVKVSAPMKCPLDYIQQFLQKKQDWIATHQARLRAHSLSDTQALQSGEQLLFLGQRYTLMIHEHAGRSGVAFEGNQLCCYLNSTATMDVKRTLIMTWQRQQMQSLLPALIQKWESIIGVKTNQWGIRAMKTRWGTCNTIKKHICLNLNLIQQPLICLEYVVVHELVHLLEASHNQRFYELMSQFMPDWKKYRSLLKRDQKSIGSD